MKAVKIPDQEAKFISELSQKTSLPEERIVRNAIKSYIYEKKWREIQRYGETLARKFKIKTEARVGQIVD